jgi:hypothetical protein
MLDLAMDCIRDKIGGGLVMACAWVDFVVEL